MTNDEVTTMLHQLHHEELGLRERKASEYATSYAFENFDVGADMMACTKSQCAWAYMVKHLASLKMHIDGRKKLTTEQLHEKVQDARLYLALIYGMEK